MTRHSHGTAALFGYLSETVRIQGFHSCLLSIQCFLLLNSEAFKAFVNTGSNHPDEEIRQLLRRDKEVDLHLPLFAEFLSIRMADNFLKYITDLLQVLFEARPEMLRGTDKKESIAFVLKHSTIEELVQALAEKKVEELSYLGTRDMVKYFADFGFQLFLAEDDLETIATLVETRNILTHNRGVVNSTFKKRLPNHPAIIGERLTPEYDTLQTLANFLTELVCDIDRRAIDKWNITTIYEM